MGCDAPFNCSNSNGQLILYRYNTGIFLRTFSVNKFTCQPAAETFFKKPEQ